MPSMFHIPQPISVFTQSGSTATSTPYLVQDYNTISIEIASAATNWQSMPVQASNDDNLQPVGSPYGTIAPLNWSTITSITTTGVFSVTPGFRWIRFGSPISSVTAVLAGNAF